jgi:hypothetical protein
VIVSLGAAGTSDCCGVITAHSEQTGQDGSPGLVQTGAGSHLDCFQIEAMVFALRSQYYLEERLDFPCDFLMNSSSRFLSTSVQPVASASTERRRQICSLSCVSSAVKS